MGNEMVIVRNPANLELWQERFSECRRSGMTVAAWCEKQGISDKTYYYWHRKLSKLQNHSRDEASSTFYEISGNINNTAEITATLHCYGVDADIYSGADEETLVRLCRALKQC